MSVNVKILIALIVGISLCQGEDDSLKQFSDANLKFSANIYKELSKTQSESFLVCPMSVEIIFALVHVGAAGSTASQIALGFNFPENRYEIENTFKKLSPTLQHTKDYNLRSANKIYIKNQFKVKDKFKNVAVDTFNAEIQEIDFDKKISAVNEINKWVEDKTNEKIKDLISENDINELTRMILINAMYFKGTWVHKFSKYETSLQPFYINSNTHTQVHTMQMTKHFKYHECSKLNAKFLEMDFKGNDISMTFVLPNEKEGLSAIENNMEEVLRMSNYTWERVYVKLPKYKIETKIDFVSILQNLGIVDAFDKQKADLSKINADPKIKLMIDKVIQKAFIEVEEAGTTAAAATAVIIAEVTSALLIPAPPKLFIADHPFLFIIRHKHGIMFLGRYNGN